MPLCNGIYIQNEDSLYEIATTYQLKSYITFALVALFKIENEASADIDLFDNRVQYYRFYLDKLFYCLGQINARFAKVSRGKRVAAKNEYIKINKNNYKFSSKDFPILSNKTPRNIIEHLDERNFQTIKTYKGVGGFNVIFSDSDSEMIDAILNNRENYPYTLDFRNKTVYFYNIQAQNDKKFQISLLDLKAELEQLEKNVNILYSYISN